MKIITFATMKGGTGKTTLSFNISSKLAEHHNVLVVDVDPQCNLSSNFNYNIFDENAITVANLFENVNTDPLDIIVQAPIPQLPNLDLMPSTMYLIGTEVRLYARTSREQVLKRYIERNATIFNYYDYIIIDTGPNMGIINQNAFFVSDHIVLITDPDCNAARGADVFLRLWNDARSITQLDDHVDGFILNNIERTKVSTELKNYVNSHPYFSKIQLKTTIPHTTRFKECGNQNLPIQLLVTKTKKEEASKIKASVAIDNLIIELKERGIL